MMSCKTRSSRGAGMADEVLTGSDPSLSDLVHKRHLRWLHKTLQLCAWLLIDYFFATHKDTWVHVRDYAERGVIFEPISTQYSC